jgi:hypothetical protein
MPNSARVVSSARGLSPVMIRARATAFHADEVFEREQNQEHRKSVPIAGPSDGTAAAGRQIR